MTDQTYPGKCQNPGCRREDGVCIGYHCTVCGQPSNEMGAGHEACHRPEPEQHAKLPATFELLDAAAERGHNAMFEGELPADGIERALWHQVVLAVLDDPQLLPGWARAARVDADNWHRQCQNLDAELQRTRRERDLAIAHDRQPYPTAPAYEQVCRVLRERTAERDALQARVDAALAKLARYDTSGGWQVTHEIVEDARAALQGDQRAEPETHCMNGSAKQHTLRMVAIIKALKAAAVNGQLPATVEPLPFAKIARAIVDHWTTEEPV